MSMKVSKEFKEELEWLLKGLKERKHKGKLAVKKWVEEVYKKHKVECSLGIREWGYAWHGPVACTVEFTSSGVVKSYSIR